MGVGSEVYAAVQMGRFAIGAELKPSYFTQALRNLLQQQIADRVTESIVDGLESIEIEKQNGIAMPLTLGVGQAGHCIAEVAAVGEPSQRVTVGEFDHLALGFPALRHIRQRSDEPAPRQRFSAHLQNHTVGAPPLVHVDESGFVLGQAVRRDRIDIRLRLVDKISVLHEVGEQIIEGRMRGQEIARKIIKLGRAAVDDQDAAIFAHHDDAVADVLER